MQAELVMVGTELLLGEVLDTNAQWLAAKLAEIGVHLYFKSTVGDNRTRLALVLTQALSRSDVVIVSGGLGPTEDDLTREVVAGDHCCTARRQSCTFASISSTSNAQCLIVFCVRRGYLRGRRLFQMREARRWEYGLRWEPNCLSHFRAYLLN
jgi:molybdenum cofactor synthesis domain-containing protein